MKRVILFAVLSFITVLHSQDTVLNTKTDEFTKLTWYIPAKNEILPNGFYLYFSQNEKTKITPLIMSINYHGSDWIFFEKMSVIAGGKNFNFEFNRYERKDDVRSGVYESYDVPVDLYPGMTDLLNTIMTTDTVKVRFQGDKSNDFTLSLAQIKTIRKYYQAYLQMAKQYGTEFEAQQAKDSVTSVSVESYIVIFLIAFVVLIGGSIYIAVNNAKKRKMEMALLRRRYEKEVEGKE